MHLARDRLAILPSDIASNFIARCLLPQCKGPLRRVVSLLSGQPSYLANLKITRFYIYCLRCYLQIKRMALQGFFQVLLFCLFFRVSSFLL